MTSSRSKAAADVELFRDIFQASPIGIVVETLDGQPLFVNPAFCSFLGFTEEELRSKHCVDFSPAEDAQKDWELFQQLRAGRIDRYQLEKRYFRKDGSLVWGRLSLSVLRNDLVPLVIAMVEDITEKKRAEEGLRESEERLRLAVQAGRMFAYSWDAVTDVIKRSGESVEILGVKNDEAATGAAISAMVHPDDRQRLNTALGRLTIQAPTLQITYRIIRPDGLVVWLQRNSHAYFDEHGKVERIIGMVVDVTDRQRAEESLRESETRFRVVADTAPVMIWMSDTNKLCTYFNKPWLDFTGRTNEQELGNGWVEGVHSEDIERCVATYTQSFDRREQFQMEYRLRHRDGEYRWILDSGVPRYTKDGAFAGYIGSCIDITERQRAEEFRLRHAAIVESSEDAIISKNLDAVIVSWNAGAQRIFGYTEPEAVGQPITILIPPELRDEETQILEKLRAGSSIEHYETTRVTKTGKRVAVSLTISPVKDSHGKMVGFCKIAHDITERKAAEDALRESEQKFRSVFRESGVGMVIVSPEGRYLAANRTFCDCLGYTEQELLGKTVESVTFPEDWPAFRERLQEALTQDGGFQLLEKRCLHKSGRIVYTENSTSLIRGRDGSPQYFVAHVQDVTLRKKAEDALSGLTRRLIEAQEQERTRIARELHDDVSQQLALLAVELDQWGQGSSGDPDLHARLEKTKRRITEIGRDVQSVSHQLHSSKLEYLGLVAAAKSFAREISDANRINIDFKEDGVPRILPNEVSLSLFRVLQQALHNAVEHSGATQVEVRLWERSNEIHLRVKDFGKGFNQSAAMQGGGLGLTSMRERVRLVNGNIVIDSKPRRGTTIHVRVPLNSNTAFEKQAG